MIYFPHLYNYILRKYQYLSGFYQEKKKKKSTLEKTDPDQISEEKKSDSGPDIREPPNPDPQPWYFHIKRNFYLPRCQLLEEVGSCYPFGQSVTKDM